MNVLMIFLMFIQLNSVKFNYLKRKNMKNFVIDTKLDLCFMKFIKFKFLNIFSRFLFFSVHVIKRINDKEVDDEIERDSEYQNGDRHDFHCI